MSYFAAFHPALQDQDGSHPVYGLASLFNREVGFAQQAVGFGRGEALIPEMDRQLEVLAEIVSQRLNLLRLDAFSPRHPKGKADDDFFDVVIADEAVKVGEIVLLVLAVKSLKTLRCDPERI